MRTRAPVPKSNPVAHTMMSNSRTPVGRLDPALGDPHDRRLPEVDERDVRAVVGLVVAGHEGRALLAEAMVLRDQPLGGLGVLDDAADLFGDELAPLARWRRGRPSGRCSCWSAWRIRGCATSSRRTPGARRSESSNGWRSWAGWRNPDGDVLRVSHMASKPARSWACSSGVIGRVVERRAPVGRALVHGQGGDLVGDGRNDLHAAGARCR